MEKPKPQPKPEVKPHHSGKGTRARLNTAANKMFYGSSNYKNNIE